MKGRHVGNTTLFCYQIIGIAQTEAFCWTKIQKPIAILFDVPILWTDKCIKQLEEICKSENVYFQRKSDGIFVVDDTCFILIRAIIEGDYEYIWINNDLNSTEEQRKDRNYTDRVLLDTIRNCSAISPYSVTFY